MTSYSALKQDIRRRMRETREPYTLARRNVLAAAPARQGTRHGARIITLLDDADRHAPAWTTLLLGALLAERGKAVTVVDLDKNSSISTLLHAYRPSALTASNDPRGTLALHEHLLEPEGLGIRVLLGPPRGTSPGDAASDPALTRANLQALAETNDFVLVNAQHPQWDERGALACQMSDLVLCLGKANDFGLEALMQEMTLLILDKADGGQGTRRDRVGVILGDAPSPLDAQRLQTYTLGCPVIARVPARAEAAVRLAAEADRLASALDDQSVRDALAPAADALLAPWCPPPAADPAPTWERGRAPFPSDVENSCDFPLGESPDGQDTSWFSLGDPHMLVGSRNRDLLREFLDNLVRHAARGHWDILLCGASTGPAAEDGSHRMRSSDTLHGILSLLNEALAEQRRREQIMDDQTLDMFLEIPGEPQGPDPMLIIVPDIDELLQHEAEGPEAGQGAAQRNAARRSILAAITEMSQDTNATTGINLVLGTPRPGRGTVPTSIRSNLGVRVSLETIDWLASRRLLEHDTGEVELPAACGWILTTYREPRPFQMYSR